MLDPILTRRVSTNSLINQLKNLKLKLLVVPRRLPKLLSGEAYSPITRRKSLLKNLLSYPSTSIGDITMSLVPLRIKGTVVHVGLSQPWPPSKVTPLLPLVNSRLSLPNNSLVACPTPTIVAVKVVAMVLLLN